MQNAREIKIVFFITLGIIFCFCKGKRTYLTEGKRATDKKVKTREMYSLNIKYNYHRLPPIALNN